MKYTITFNGARNGGLNPSNREMVSRVVEADNADKALIKAYDTHEHLNYWQVKDMSGNVLLSSKKSEIGTQNS